MSLGDKKKEIENKIVEDFHKLYYGNGSQTWSGNTSWLGHKILKCPLDLWIYQEIVYKIKPDIIIECGNGDAGCTLFLANILDAIYGDSSNGKGTVGTVGTVIAIDTENTNHKEILPEHKRIKYIAGMSTSDDTIIQVRQIIKFPIKSPMLIILDSDHHKENVLKELEIYSKFAVKDSYMVVEDTNLSGHPNFTDFLGPWEAVEEFLSNSDNNKKFIVDSGMEKFYMTFNPRGYLKRI